MTNNPIHRALAIRLAATAASIALILMSVIFWVELQNLDLRVQDQATTAVERLRWSIINELDTEGLGDHDQIQRILEKGLTSRKAPAQSSFAYVRVLDPAFREVAKVSDPVYAQIQLVIHRTKSNPNVKDVTETALWNRITKANGFVVIQLAKVLDDSKGKPAAYIEGAYVISPAFIRKARYDAILSALLAAGIVLITALILYPTIMGLLGKVSGLSAGLVHANLDILSVLGGALAKRDSETAIHTCRVTLYAIRIAQEVGLKDHEMRALIKGAFLHDVGKIGVRDSVLLKPGSLTSEEFEETKEHVRHGLDIVNRSIWLADAAPVVGGHHEKYDGSGYPEGRKGEEIPRIARIFAVADVFDALTSKRPYKETMGCVSAIEIICRDRASHFDPEILDVFVKIAPDLHKTFAEMAEETLRIEMKHSGARYFLSNLGGSFDESMSRNEIKAQ